MKSKRNIKGYVAFPKNWVEGEGVKRGHCEASKSRGQRSGLQASGFREKAKSRENVWGSGKRWGIAAGKHG